MAGADETTATRTIASAIVAVITCWQRPPYAPLLKCVVTLACLLDVGTQGPLAQPVMHAVVANCEVVYCIIVSCCCRCSGVRVLQYVRPGCMRGVLLQAGALCLYRLLQQLPAACDEAHGGGVSSGSGDGAAAVGSLAASRRAVEVCDAVGRGSDLHLFLALDHWRRVDVRCAHVQNQHCASCPRWIGEDESCRSDGGELGVGRLRVAFFTFGTSPGSWLRFQSWARGPQCQRKHLVGARRLV
jgi:hypothetical protein